MNRHVNAISGRLSLRSPQRESLDILARVTELIPLRKNTDLLKALEMIRAEYPDITDFEREFPSLCFSLATGVGKTRLMGAFISYLHIAHGINNFFVLAPNLTIYKKLISDFQKGSPKYVFKGITELSIEQPFVITGDDYQEIAGNLFDQVVRCKINIFNISKINSEVRGGKQPKIKRLAEYIGQSYFEYLSELPDLVLLMDESHRYRASAGVKAINELKPVLGLELTATPFVEGNKAPIHFKNIIYDYSLAQAMEDGFVKEPAVVTRKDFNASGMAPEDIEQLKLEDGIRLHEATKVELNTYARETGKLIIKPFVLVIARDTVHAGQLEKLIQSENFFAGQYKGKVIQVDSSQTGEKEDAMIERLLSVENAEEPTEIVIHVNMLKEGWDVTNLYTIVPLRAANARTLIAQTIGRGLRLPYGKRTGVPAVDRLSIVAHDKFQEIVDEASRPDSLVKLQNRILDIDELKQKTVTVISYSKLDQQLGAHKNLQTENEASVFVTEEEQRIAQITQNIIQKMASNVGLLPSSGHLQKESVQEILIRETQAEYSFVQTYIPGIIKDEPDIKKIVSTTAELIAKQTIDIPRIFLQAATIKNSGFRQFDIKFGNNKFLPPEENIWVHYLRTGENLELGVKEGGIQEGRLEDHVVFSLLDYNDVSYEENAEFLYNLASQVIRYLQSYLKHEQIAKTLIYHRKEIARFVHSQMLEHYWEEKSEDEFVVKSGFSPLKQCAYTAILGQEPLDFRVPPEDKTNMMKYVFAGFSKCLYQVQKFSSDAERQLAVILERESEKWFRPALGQFQIFYNQDNQYQPDFVAATKDSIFMLEVKRRSELDNADVLAKKEAAFLWCKRASDYARKHEGKPWFYALIPHDRISQNITISGIKRDFC
jgi:type III restriction enzyme